MADTATDVDVPLEKIIEKYIALRDLKKVKAEAFKKEIEPIDTAMARCEAFIMATMQRIGVDNVKTKFGTAYKKNTSFATVADWPQILDWVKDTGNWELLKRDVSKAFVETFKEEHNDLPPGINYRVETVVNIRRD